MLKQGDRVLVWSLQSFLGGGFLKGEPAFVRQTQHSSRGSVILCVIRNIDGIYQIDDGYEVYPEQVKVVKKKKWNAEKRLADFRTLIMNNSTIR